MEKLKISSKNLNEIIEKTAKLIRRGGVMVCPTDTVYGLVADATNEKAVRKIFKIKKRSLKKPIPIFVKDLKMAKRLAVINKSQEKFLKKVWPGKVTVVLRAKTKKLPKGVVSVDKKIGLRIPNYKIINRLLTILNRPLTGTSANISGKPASTKIKEVLKQFKCRNSHGSVRISRGQRPRVGLFACPDLILDAGNLKPSLPSTVVDLENFKILREGQFPKRKILAILNNVIR